jgi:uncharacterized hydrophobic protein (TIGR00271 family)
MIHLRLVVPCDRTEVALSLLLERPDVVNVMHLPRVSLRPAGDLVQCDVARESTDELLAQLHTLGIDVGGTIAMEAMDMLVSQRPNALEQNGYQEAAESVVWESVEASAANDVRGGWTFYVFLTLGVALATISVKLDSAITVIAAMIVSPDFSPVAAACVGTVRPRQRHLIGKACRLFVSGFAVAIAVVSALAFFATIADWLTLQDLVAPRPQTDFIWKPDRWSFVVALLAGAAGILALTSSRANAMVGVFVAVTTVPAAANLAFALAVGLHRLLLPGSGVHDAVPGDTIWLEIGGSAAQLLVNVAGMFVAGVCTLLIAQWVNRRTTTSNRTSKSALTFQPTKMKQNVYSKPDASSSTADG